MYPHRIRLCGPWESEPITDTPLPRRTVRHRRRFGWPGRLDSHERVWLTFASVKGSADVWLNDVPLGRREGNREAFAFDVTSLLQVRNRLCVEVTAPADEGGQWGEVALEVRCLAYLQNVRAWATPARLHVAGVAVGTSERPLDLYVLLDGRNVAYATVKPSPEGQPFEVVSEELPAVSLGDRRTIRVEMVNGATVWYQLEGTFVFGEAVDLSAGV